MLSLLLKSFNHKSTNDRMPKSVRAFEEINNVIKKENITAVGLSRRVIPINNSGLKWLIKIAAQVQYGIRTKMFQYVRQAYLEKDT